jgi:hypothetical protein
MFRMELEQAKLEELEGGDSRVANEEDTEDPGDTPIDQHRANFTFGNSNEISGKDKNEKSDIDRPALGKSLRGENRSRESTGMQNGGLLDQGVWNDEVMQYSTILPGHHCARRRFDSDKQAVICQISDLDFADLFAIVLSCQFSLCVYYARSAFLRILKLANSLHSVVSPQHALWEEVMSTILGDSDNSDDTLVKLLPLCFQQGLGSGVHPERLFPSQLRGSALGDPLDLNPPTAPFSTCSTISFTQILSQLETKLYGMPICTADQEERPQCIGSIAVDETSLQVVQ